MHSFNAATVFQFQPDGIGRTALRFVTGSTGRVPRVARARKFSDSGSPENKGQNVQLALKSGRRCPLWPEFTSALPPKADIREGAAKRPLMTQSGPALD